MTADPTILHTQRLQNLIEGTATQEVEDQVAECEVDGAALRFIARVMTDSRNRFGPPLNEESQRALWLSGFIIGCKWRDECAALKDGHPANTVSSAQVAVDAIEKLSTLKSAIRNLANNLALQSDPYSRDACTALQQILDGKPDGS